MCGDTENRCKNPEKLRGRPEECSPEQVRECHGDAKKHPCVSPGKKGKGE